MQFSDSSGKTGIVEMIDFLVGSDSTKYPTAQKTRNVNVWYRRIVGWIWEASGGWTFDDINASTLPVATTTLVDNQRDYSLPTTNGAEFGEIERVEVKDSSGNYYHISKIDKSSVQSTALSEYYKTKGRPEEYYFEGNSIILLPAPDTTQVTASAGLKIYLSRDIDEFTSSDTTQEPGFNRNWHPALAYGGALDYAIAKGLFDLATTLKNVLGVNELIQKPHGFKKDIVSYYARRNTKDVNQARRIIKTSYR